MTITAPLSHPPADPLTRLRVLLRIARRPIAVAAAAGAAAAFLASGGQLGPAVVAALLGAASGVLSLSLTLASVETRWALAWPRLHLRGWQPRPALARGADPHELPLELYGAGEAALSNCRAARRVLGVRASRFGRRVVALVSRGEAAFERAAVARIFLEASTALAAPSEEAPGAEDSALARVLAKSACARAAREQQVVARLAAAVAEVEGATRVLGDLALRLSGIEAELSSAEAERRQLLPCLSQLHQEMSALEQAASLELEVTP